MNNILIPRNLDSREEQRKRIDYQRIQEYIKNGSVGSLHLEDTPLIKLPDELTIIGGSLGINHSSIEDLNNLKTIEKSLYADSSKLKSLPSKLTRIGWNLSLTGCPVNNIDNLEYVKNHLWINHTNIDELPEGLEVGGALYCYDTPLSKKYRNITSFEKYLEERNIRVRGKLIIK